MSFVGDYLEHTKLYESPSSFWKWSAYAAIAAVLRDSVFRKQGDIITYPNIYVLFLAQSGARKGAPINFSKELIQKVNNTKIIAGRSSIQAIIDELAHTETNSKTGKLIKGGSAILVAGELAAGIVGDPAAIGILTDIYDLKTDFKHHLRSTGRFKIDRIVFNMLAASNADLLKEVYTQSAVSGGLLARTFLVVPDEFRPPNSLMDEIDVSISAESLYKKLLCISQLAGEIVITPAAKKEYEAWYKPYYTSLKGKGDKSGVLARLHMGVFKIAIILAANNVTLELTHKHVEEAISECMNLIPNYNTFVMASGKSTVSEAGSLFFPELFAAEDYTISRKKFLQKHWTNVDSETFDKLVITLEQGGLIQSIAYGNEMAYKLTQKAIELGEGKKNANGT